MLIRDFIIHRIDKTQRNDPAVHLRSESLKVTDPRVTKFTALAVDVFKANEDKPSSVFADFHADTANYPFSEWCLAYFAGNKPFVEFTKDCTNRLSLQMKAQPLSTGGFVVFATFEESQKVHLLIVMLHPQDGLSITDQLEFEEVSHLELKQVDKAALVAAPTNGVFGDKPLSYAGFRKEMSHYFQEFVGPDAFRNPTKDSHKLIEALEDFARDNNFDDGKLDGIRVALRTYAKESSDAGKELDLAVVSAMVHPADQNAFRTFASLRGISGFIKPDNAVFKKWKIIRYKSSDGLVLQFKAETVGSKGTGHRLQLDESKKTLTITKIEDDLIAKIKGSRISST